MSIFAKMSKYRTCSSVAFQGIFADRDIAILTVTLPIVINVPTRGSLAVETKDSFVLWLAKFKYQKTCL